MRTIFHTKLLFDAKYPCLLFFLCLVTYLSSTFTSLHKEYERFITVVTYTEKDQKYIDSVKSELSHLIINFQFEVKSFQDIPVTIHIAPDFKTYKEWIADKEAVFESSLAFADLAKNDIYILHPTNVKDNKRFIRTLLHEYIHIFIHETWHDAPLWFHEGMATYFSEGVTFTHIMQFMTNNAFHNKYLLHKHAHTYPVYKRDIEPFYFQSVMLIKRAFDDDKKRFLLLFEIGNLSESFEETFQSSFNMTIDDLLTSFSLYMAVFFRMSLYKGIILCSWLIFPILLLIARIRKEVKTRKLLKEWDKESQLSPTESHTMPSGE